MKEEVIVHKLLITRIRERVHFQVRLPKDAKRIIGLEYDARKIDGNSYVSRIAFIDYGPAGDPSFNRHKSKLIGRLSLGNCNCEGLFYQGDLIEDRNEAQYEGIAAYCYTPKKWINSTKREETNFNVKAGFLYGLFEDHFGVNEYTELEYELSLYFWIEKCET